MIKMKIFYGKNAPQATFLHKRKWDKILQTILSKYHQVYYLNITVADST